VAILFLFFFIRSVMAGQYDDDTSPAIRILDKPSIKKESSNKN
jgi:cbb3-type cytochrome oxidase maturation protein